MSLIKLFKVKILTLNIKREYIKREIYILCALKN